MTIYQTNVWICEICGAIESSTEEVFPYGDPVVIEPNGNVWEYTRDYPNEKLACPKCLKKFSNLQEDETPLTKKDFQILKENFERLLKHLEKIAKAMDIEYMDGDFPIEDVLEKIYGYETSRRRNLV